MKDGQEIRGFRIRLYPDVETEQKLQVLAEDCRYAWNWLINRFNETRQASEAFAVREGLVPSKPVTPDYDGMAPEESERAAEAHRACWREWRKQYSAAIKDRSECRAYNLTDWMLHFGCKFDYQFLTRVVEWRGVEERTTRPRAHMLQALAKNYFEALKAIKRRGSGRLQKKRAQDPVPIQVRSGTCFELGDFGERGPAGRRRAFYNCQVRINGLRIRGRLPGKTPNGRILEGVSLTREADGWWASIKVEAPKRVLPDPIPGTVVGIDVGLENLVAFDDGHREPNVRDRMYSLQIAEMQKLKRPTGRLQQRQARHVRHVIYSKVIPRVRDAAIIAIEDIPSDLGQRGRRHVSMMRTVQNMLVARYGDRVRAVPPEYTSQCCSKCDPKLKHPIKSDWEWTPETGPIGTCSRCGHREHRDVNAARNIAHRAAEQQAS